MNKKLISDSQGFTVSPETRHSFGGSPIFTELSGPGTLVKLVQFDKTNCDGLALGNSRISGRFQFEEQLLLCLLCQGRDDLARQQTAAKQTFSTPLLVLIGNCVRHCLQANLAIWTDWTNDFDSFVWLRLMPEDRLTALFGTVTRQPAYSKTHELHQNIVAKDIWFKGRATQFVIYLNFPVSWLCSGRIMWPFCL